MSFQEEPNISDSDSELDDKWIIQFENTDKLYQEYYLDSIHYVSVYFIYVNTTNCIEKIKEEIFIMSKLGSILRNELIDLIKCNCMMHNKKYSLLSLLKYNITIDPTEIKQYSKAQLNNRDELIDFGNKYLTVVRHIDTVFFQNTIHMFHDLNSLIIVFYNDNNNDETKNKPNTKQQQHSTTKKIKLDTIVKIHMHNKNTKSKSKTKTIRKQYKD
jgi:hypothetical protein